MNCESQLLASNKVLEMKRQSPPVASDEAPVQEMKPESTRMGSIEDINPIRKLQETETKNLPCGDLLGNRDLYSQICAPLYYASMNGDWEAAQLIFDTHQHLDLVGYSISENNDTALHIAAGAESSKSVDNFVENIVNMMTTQQLELKNDNDNTALCLAIAGGNMKTVMTLLEKNPALVDIPGSGGMMPLYMASLFGGSEMLNYLYDKSEQMSFGDCWTYMQRGLVLQNCVQTDHFDIALKIVSRWPQLAKNGIILGVLAKKTDAFNGTKPHFIWRILCPFMAVIHEKFEASEKPSDAMKLLKIIWAEIMTLPKDEINCIIRGPADKPTTIRKEKEDVQQLLVKLPDGLYKLISAHQNPTETIHEPAFSSHVLFVAAEMGNIEFLVELFSRYPDLIWKTNENHQTIFHVAVINRHEGIYNLLHEIGSMKDMITSMKDKEGNNMLHLVGKYAKYDPIEDDSPGIGLQMQRELLWFKEVKALLRPSYRERKNNDGLTAHALFMEEHKDLLFANEKWMKDTANQCLVVGALIASIAFAAAFGVPGGYNQINGIPMFVHNRFFIAFAILDAISLTFSSISILIFISLFISRYNELNFLESLPKKLLVGLGTLFISIIAMLVGFSVSFFVIFQDHFIWVPIIIAYFMSMPILVYARFHAYNLIGNLYISIDNFKDLFIPKKRRLFYQNPSF